MNKYQKAKARARERAVDWQRDFENHNYSYGELADWADRFRRLAERFGLVREFRENGII